jgi:hypothetical protein
MKRHYLSDCKLSAKAEALADFDMDSIRQIVSAKRSNPPTVWLADPDQYEHNGRLLRDSTSPRLIAYSADDRILYATDGCNTCEHRLSVDFNALSQDAIHTLSDQSHIPLNLLEHLHALIQVTG